MGSGPRLETLDADFGLGKGEAAIDPAVALGSPSGTGFAIVGAVVTITDEDTKVTVTCTVATSGKCLAADDQYNLLDPSGSGQPTVPGTFFYDSGHTITITQTLVPTGFRVYPGVSTSLSIDGCTIDGQPLCQPTASSVTFYNGYLVSLGLLKTNQSTGAPLGGATYRLCATAPVPPVPTVPPVLTTLDTRPSLIAEAAAPDCPAGSTAAGSATSGPDGRLVFPGLVDPDSKYHAIEVVAPAGFGLDPTPILLTLTAPASFAAVGATQFTAVADSPSPVVTPTSTATSTVLATISSTATTISSTATTVTATTIPSSSTVRSTATTSTLSVAAVVTTTTGPPQLANTGAAIEQLVVAALGSLAAGLLMLMMGRRRVRTQRQH